jgi:hypothetical protein
MQLPATFHAASRQLLGFRVQGLIHKLHLLLRDDAGERARRLPYLPYTLNSKPRHGNPEPDEPWR